MTRRAVAVMCLVGAMSLAGCSCNDDKVVSVPETPKADCPARVQGSRFSVCAGTWAPKLSAANSGSKSTEPDVQMLPAASGARFSVTGEVARE